MTSYNNNSSINGNNNNNNANNSNAAAVTSRNLSNVSKSLSETNFLRWVIVVWAEQLTQTDTDVDGQADKHTQANIDRQTDRQS